MVDPLPCPFCGAKPSSDESNFGAVIYCENLGCRVGVTAGGNTIQETTAIWNQRSPYEDALAAAGALDRTRVIVIEDLRRRLREAEEAVATRNR